MSLTLDDIKKLQKLGRIVGYVDKFQAKGVTNGYTPPKSKYGNEKIEVDGILFDSKREAKRWSELRLLLKIGAVGLLERQIPYELNEGGTHSLKYIADFRYVLSDTGAIVVEDAKGMKTREYLKKKRLMKKIYGIDIKET